MYASDLRHSSASLEDKLGFLYGLGRGRRIDLSFRSSYLDLLKALGNPHFNLPPVIHVAGTNGKGSIIAILQAILKEAGYHVHAYTSPHLCAFNERIVLNSMPISNDFLESLIEEALRLNRGNEVTFFEITTALAFAAFSRTPADVLLLEVGLGGRFDCTNVVEKPIVSVISSIGYDHMEFLGGTLQKIASEKAGIIKAGCPCVISYQSADAVAEGVMDIFSQTAGQNKSPLERYGSEWFTTAENDLFKFVHKDVEMSLPLPNLPGSHQIVNAGAALASLCSIKKQFPVSQEAIKQGLRKIAWPGRLQELTHDYNLPPGWELWLDGGHNADASRILSDWAGGQKDPKPLYLVLGMMNSKDPVKFLKLLERHMAGVFFIDIPNEPQAYASDELAQRAKKAFPELSINTAADFQEAIQNILSEDEAPGRILIAGSLYLAGHVLKCRPKRP